MHIFATEKNGILQYIIPSDFAEISKLLKKTYISLFF